MNDGEIVYRCPVKSVNRCTANYISMHNNCDKFGKLPFAGSLAVQPAKIMQVFSLIQSVTNERTKEKMENTKHAKNRP